MSKSKKITNSDDEKFPLPEYSPKDDIYAREEESEIDPETRMEKTSPEDDDNRDRGLDIPGADLDDEDEKIGEEDEENNYYSLGGDDHDDLEDDRSDDMVNQGE